LRSFDEFACAYQSRFTDALVARFGPQLGVDASAHAMAYAFEHWTRVGAMERPLAYLYRVAQSSLRPHWRWLRHRSIAFPPELATRETGERIDLSRALTTLSEEQRVSVLLIHAYGWTYREVAELLDYAHLASFADGIEDGVAVKAGDPLGEVGRTGNAPQTPPHLHFEVHLLDGGPINPYHDLHNQYRQETGGEHVVTPEELTEAYNTLSKSDKEAILPTEPSNK
jgi:hypothetical protein